ncbi:hypothetical protein Bra3105_17380 [Brachybacterium halotolerans subsp. kimchii]|uniref:DUF6541 family protein n=1 Tax=Brachybacterium halotolerans TaxID=2795215 RepID=UPI001E290877|nr:DUF6541 family protein [Brachybacterium halotolerans]UEJ82578.1 hypothetical protein Bra3105_17380 [Brachybacterium halotolerans subsp. kimchii]
MTDLLLLVVAGIVVLAAAVVPGFLAVRVLGGGRLLALALAPALGSAIAGVGAVIAGKAGVPWSLATFGVLSTLMIAIGLLARRLGLRLPATVLDGRPVVEGSDGADASDGPALRRRVPGGPWWILGAALVAIVPIAYAAGGADRILERWDTLYHLSALERIRETGDASSLVIGTVASTTGQPNPYPGGFHALASLVPLVPIPVLLNAACLVLAVVPWVSGLALLARALWPEVSWGPFAASVVGLLAPAAPWDEWIHLSAIPNMVGFAMLPGVTAAIVALWGALLKEATGEGPGDSPAPGHGIPGRPVLRHLASVLALGGAGLGLALMHPNVAVTALLLIAALSAVTALPHARRRLWLLAVPIAALVPVGLLSWTPLAAVVTDFGGGLKVSWWTGLGELLLGLLTVWPMALGVILALLWWPGLVASWRSPQRWLVIAWIVMGVLYFDSAIDSPLNLSTLYYRGQDRLSMPVTMLTSVLVIPGLRAWSRVIAPHGEKIPRWGAAVLTLLAVVAAASSVPTRIDNAQMNLAWTYEGRGRFLQQDEVEAWAKAAPEMDTSRKVLASPFSGASHMYAIHGQQVYFPVAGMALTSQDRALLYAISGSNGPVPLAEQCQMLEDANVGYIYKEYTTYSWSSTFDLVNRASQDLGTTVFTTDHSQLIRVDCDSGT